MACASLLVPGSLFLLLSAEDFSDAVVFSTQAFQRPCSKPFHKVSWQSCCRGPVFVSASQLVAGLNDPATQLLALPYGPLFLKKRGLASCISVRGGNLLASGDCLFTRAAYREGAAWKLCDDSVRFARQLMIDQYQFIHPAQTDWNSRRNPDTTLQLARFEWKEADSP